MAKFDIIADDTRALYVMDGELKATLDGGGAGGEWWGKKGEGEWDCDGDVTTLYDYEGNVVATLSNDDEWEKWLA